MSGPPSVVVAGVGNVLRGDDGFGPAVVRAFEASAPPPWVRTVEVGIGGMGIVHALMEGADALVVVDAVDRGGAPGTLYLLEPEIPAPDEIPRGRRGEMADLHLLLPERMLLLARALEVLPSFVRIVGCEAGETEELTTELSPSVARVVPEAVRTIERLLEEIAAPAVEVPGD